MSPKVSIVVATYNRAKDLQRLLASLDAQAFRDSEVIVVNNASTDNTREVLAARPDLRVVEDGTKNLSYLSNLGWRLARGEVVAFISDDCEAHPRWVETLVRALEEHPDVDVIGGPAITTRDQQIAGLVARSEARPVLGLLARAYHRLVLEGRYDEVGRFCESGAFTNGGSRPHSAQLPGPVEVDVVTLTNMAVRRRLLAEGGFDERILFNHGDGDFCLRLRRQGRVVLFHPGAVVWHHPNPEGPTRGAYRLGRDYAFFFMKNIRPRSMAGYVRWFAHMACFNGYWFYRAVQARSPVPLQGLAGFARGALAGLRVRWARAPAAPPSPGVAAR